MRIKTWVMALLTVVILLGGVGVSAALGQWKTTTDKQPATIQSGDYAGQANPADIRGSYTLSDISKSFGIPLEDMGIAFVPEDKAAWATFKCKDLESRYGEMGEGIEIGTASMRYFVALYVGIPGQQPAALPSTAVEVLKGKAALSEDQLAELEQYTVDTK